jgi:putative heme iron utilization protein
VLGTLATLTADGDPWASVVSYGVLADGSPVLCVSMLAEHGRNLQADPRASIAIASQSEGGELLDRGRVTLAGVAERPEGDELAAARAAHLAAMPSAKAYIDFHDFSLWVLRVQRVRWVGGFGRMESTTAEQYAAAETDPVAAAAPGAIRHLNSDHPDALLAMAQTLAGYTDATGARCQRLDRYGLDLMVVTPRGSVSVRVPWTERVEAPNGLRMAAVELARRAGAASGH